MHCFITKFFMIFLLPHPYIQTVSFFP